MQLYYISKIFAWNYYITRIAKQKVIQQGIRIIKYSMSITVTTPQPDIFKSNLITLKQLWTSKANEQTMKQKLYSLMNKLPIEYQKSILEFCFSSQSAHNYGTNSDYVAITTRNINYLDCQDNDAMVYANVNLMINQNGNVCIIPRSNNKRYTNFSSISNRRQDSQDNVSQAISNTNNIIDLGHNAHTLCTASKIFKHLDCSNNKEKKISQFEHFINNYSQFNQSQLSVLNYNLACLAESLGMDDKATRIINKYLPKSKDKPKYITTDNILRFFQLLKGRIILKKYIKNPLILQRTKNQMYINQNKTKTQLSKTQQTLIQRFTNFTSVSTDRNHQYIKSQKLCSLHQIYNIALCLKFNRIYRRSAQIFKKIISDVSIQDIISILAKINLAECLFNFGEIGKAVNLIHGLIDQNNYHVQDYLQQLKSKVYVWSKSDQILSIAKNYNTNYCQQTFRLITRNSQICPNYTQSNPFIKQISQYQIRQLSDQSKIQQLNTNLNNLRYKLTADPSMNKVLLKSKKINFLEEKFLQLNLLYDKIKAHPSHNNKNISKKKDDRYQYQKTTIRLNRKRYNHNFFPQTKTYKHTNINTATKTSKLQLKKCETEFLSTLNNLPHPKPMKTSSYNSKSIIANSKVCSQNNQPDIKSERKQNKSASGYYFKNQTSLFNKNKINNFETIDTFGIFSNLNIDNGGFIDSSEEIQSNTNINNKDSYRVQNVQAENKWADQYLIDHYWAIIKNSKDQNQITEKYLNLGDVYMKQKDYQSALMAYKKALQRGRYEAFGRIGNLYYYRNKQKNSIQYFQKYLKFVNQQDHQIQLKLLHCYSKVPQKYKKASQKLRQILQKNPYNKQAHILYVTVLMKLKHYERAICQCLKFKQINYMCYENLHIMGMLYKLIDKNKEAFSCFISALRICPQNVSSLIQLTYLTQINGFLPQLIQIYKKALLLNKRNHQILQILYILTSKKQLQFQQVKHSLNFSQLVVIGDFFIQNQMLQQAQLTYKEARQYTNNTLLKQKFGNLQYLKKNYKQAEKWYKQSQKRKPTFRIQVKLGHSLLKQNKFEQAYAIFQQCISKQSSDKSICLNMLGQCQYGMGNYSQAILRFQQSSKYTTDNHINRLWENACRKKLTQQMRKNRINKRPPVEISQQLQF